MRTKPVLTDDDIRAIAVKVLCGSDGATLAASVPLDSGPALREQRLDFEIPAADCEGQTLEITPVPGDRRATASAWFDRWSLTRR